MPAALSSSPGDVPLASLGQAVKGTSLPEGQNAGDYFHLDGQGNSTRFTDKPVQYRLYRRRFAGLAALCLLNIVAAMNWLAFSAIALNLSKDFQISLLQVNWLANIVNLIYLPASCAIPTLCLHYGMRPVCIGGAACLLLASWIRYAATASSLSSGSSYTLLFIAQIFTGMAEPVFQVLGPRYSEVWFDLKTRTTATMIVAIANPIGSALGQLLPPLIANGDTRFAILILGVITTAALPSVFFIQSNPPTPPTFSGAQESPQMVDTLRSFIGRETKYAHTHVMSKTERIDFFILTIVFGVLVAGTGSFAIFINQIFAPYGYSDDASGIIGAVLLLSGIVGAFASAPLFDRYLTHHLALSAKILVPVLCGAWIAVIFAVAPNNYGGIYTVVVLIGIASFILLPVALELGCETTRNAETSSALLWFSGNLFSFIFVLVEDALREGFDATPPLNMRRGLIFNGSIIAISCLLIVGLTGKQSRRELDVEKSKVITSET